MMGGAALEIIADLRRTDRVGYEREGRAYWPLFGREVKVALGKGVSLDYAQRCAAQLIHPPPETVRQLLEASARYFRDVEYCHGEPLTFLFEFEGMPQPQNLEEPENLLPYIQPMELCIDEEVPGSFSAFAFLECAWEPEEGMQWVVRDGRPLFVGAYGGLGSHREEEVYLSVWRSSNYL